MANLSRARSPLQFDVVGHYTVEARR